MIRAFLALIFLASTCCADVIVTGVGEISKEWIHEHCHDLRQCREALINALLSEGHLNASARIEISGSDTTLVVDGGMLYRVRNLALNGVDDSLTARARLAMGEDRALDLSTLESLLIAITRELAERGYPFAKLEIRDMRLTSDFIELECLLIPGPRANIGAIRYSGLRTTLPQTLDSRIGLQLGSRYRESDLTRTATALSRLDFCRLDGAPLVLFDSRTERVDLQFPMHDSRNVALDGGVILLPDNTLAGNVDARLLNLLGGGRRLHLAWSKKDVQSQSLQFALLLPYFSGYPLDLSLTLEQTDRDSSFISTGAAAGLDYHLSPDWSAGGEFGWTKVTPEENRIGPSARELSVTLSTIFDNRDDSFRTLKGALLKYHFRSSYRREFGNGEEVVTGYSTELDADIALWRRIRGALTLYGRLHAFQIRSDFEPIPQDRLLAIGGTRSLRGYRENSFLARLGALSTIELRWYALDRLMLRIFTDNGYISTLSYDLGLTGFGAGISVATNLGVVRFDLSLGEEKTLSRMLVHFGFEAEL